MAPLQTSFIRLTGLLLPFLVGCNQPNNQDDPRQPNQSADANPQSPERPAVVDSPVEARPRYNKALPGIVIDQQEKTLAVDGEISLERGMLEYLAVAPQGKAYESLLLLKCRPADLRAALHLAGFTAGEVPAEARGDFAPRAKEPVATQPEGAPKTPQPPAEYWAQGSKKPSEMQLDVEVRQVDGSWKRSPIERFLLSRETWESPPRLTWAFTGSFFRKDPTSGEEIFVADVEKSLIALWYDPSALLNPSETVGNPYRVKNAGLEVHGLHVPQKGTAVRLLIRRTP